MEALKLVEPEKRKKDKPYDTVHKRRTKEQIVALCGPVGSGIKEVSNRIAESFKRYGYEVEPVKASDLILEAINTLIDTKIVEKAKFKTLDWPSEGDRISSLQDMGDWLRESYGYDIVSQLFIKKVSTNRQIEITQEEAEKGELHKESRPVVWILDSLKHPEEVKLLRIVYDKMFSLFGVLCPLEVKKHNLVESFGITPDQALDLIKRDESEDINHGQKLIKTLQFGDFFVRNAQYESQRVADAIDRFVKILLGDHSVTPTHGEYAMFLAQSAAYRSGCMSRQVGAAIVNTQGEIISTGFNDVPKFAGGLYVENPDKDARCFKVYGGECKNDAKKRKIKNTLLTLISQKAPGQVIDNSFVDTLCDSAGISDLTEYCRAVHAEMDAVTSAARKGVSLREGTIYVTTFPCHNCAKHIIASGIRKVFYIEPYEKSLAIALHDDSVATESREDAVAFLPFEGVSPRQYQNRFCSTTNKKLNGKFIKVELGEETPAYAQLMDCFADYEVKVVDSLADNGL